jgi:hypothetical protein
MATTSGNSGAISLNSIHVEVGEGNPTTIGSIGDADIRNRMGYGSSAVSFSNFYKSWGTTMTHGSSTVAATKFNPASSNQGFANHQVLFGPSAMGSLSDESIHGSSVSGQTLWADQIYSSSIYTQNYFVMHDGSSPLTASASIPVAPQATDPFRGTNALRLCWNDSARLILGSPAPTAQYVYWQNLTLPSSGSYDFAIKWS